MTTLIVELVSTVVGIVAAAIVGWLYRLRRHQITRG